jgi:hypothetical protein
MIHLVVGQGPYMRQVRVPIWMLAILGGTAILVSFVLLTFLASLALLAIPACLIGAAAARWLNGSRGARREPIFTRDRRSRSDIIEGEYRVLGEREPR